MGYATNGVEEDISMNMSTAQYEQMKTVSDICLPEPCQYFYGQFINCEDFPELRVENYNYVNTGDENDNENANEEDDNVSTSTTSSSSKVVLGSAAALTTVLSIGSSL